jgi:hypothetical protein
MVLTKCFRRAVRCRGEAGNGVDGSDWSLLDVRCFGARNGNTRVGKRKDGVEVVIMMLFIGSEWWEDGRSGRRHGSSRWILMHRFHSGKK